VARVSILAAGAGRRDFPPCCAHFADGVSTNCPKLRNEEDETMAIGLSHGGSTIYSSPTLSKEVLVGTREGIAVIEREGSDWRVTQCALTDKHVSAIINEPESGLTFAGAFHGSIHASADGGNTWHARSHVLTAANASSL